MANATEGTEDAKKEQGNSSKMIMGAAAALVAAGILYKVTAKAEVIPQPTVNDLIEAAPTKRAKIVRPKVEPEAKKESSEEEDEEEE